MIGLIENMSYFECPGCGRRAEIFSHGGGRREAKRLDVPFLGEIPLDPAIRSASDGGRPIATGADESDSRVAAFLGIAAAVGTALEPHDEPSAKRGGIFERFRRARGKTGG